MSSSNSEVERVPLDLDPIRLQQRVQDAGTISGRLAHAFDNILTGILGFAELSLAQTEAGSPVRPLLEEVLRAAQNGVQLTQQLHQLSRCATPTCGPTCLADLVEDQQARWRSQLEAGVTLHVRLANDLPPVAMDALALQQILTHLLDNAREALNGQGTIALSANRAELNGELPKDLLGQPLPGAYLEMVVHDTGPGITPDVRRRLLHEPFFTTKPRHRGLGLAVVYRILHAHRGCFRLNSQPNQGTAVQVFLPLAR